MYACGESQALPAIEERAAAMQALLHAISRASDSVQQGHLIQNKNAVWVLRGDR